MSVSRVLLLLAAAGCHCARNKSPGRNEVNFENINKEWVQSKNSLVQASGGGGMVRSGVLSPRPDVIGPRDMARLALSARRAYESETDGAEKFQKHYGDAERLENTKKRSQSRVALRNNIHFTTAQSITPSTLSANRGLMTQQQSLLPNLPGYTSQKSTSLGGYDMFLLDNDAPPQELNLPVFGEGPIDVAGETEPAGPSDKNNLSAATAGTGKLITMVPMPRFRLENGFSQPSPPNTLKKQRFNNFVKFIQANKDLVQEYIDKKRWSSKTTSRSGRAQGGPFGVHRWSFNPMREGMPTPNELAQMSLPAATGWIRERMSQEISGATKAGFTGAIPESSQEKMVQYAATDDPRMLDLAPAQGALISRMRIKGRICQRHVLLPEGPKYNRHGSVYLAAFQSIYDKDFPQTRAPRMVLPNCCNCCRKSVLGCK